MRQLETRGPVFVFVLVALVLQGAAAGVTQSFHKRTPSPALSANHPKLKRKADAGPYTPEQVRLCWFEVKIECRCACAACYPADTLMP